MAQRKPFGFRKPLFRPQQLLLLAYLLAAALWLAQALVGSAVMLNYKLRGEMPQRTVPAAELTTESFAPYSSNQWWTPPDDDPNWYLSTDSDPHIYWQGQGYLETVRLDAVHRLPPEGVALYYLLPGQTRTYPKGDYFYLSVFPAEGKAEGVTIRGAFYELTGAQLTASYPLGVSNEYAPGSDCITLSVEKGALVVVETAAD